MARYLIHMSTHTHTHTHTHTRARWTASEGAMSEPGADLQLCNRDTTLN
jgi:hypothetical protein